MVLEGMHFGPWRRVTAGEVLLPSLSTCAVWTSTVHCVDHAWASGNMVATKERDARFRILMMGRNMISRDLGSFYTIAGFFWNSPNPDSTQSHPSTAQASQKTMDADIANNLSASICGTCRRAAEQSVLFRPHVSMYHSGMGMVKGLNSSWACSMRHPQAKFFEYIAHFKTEGQNISLHASCVAFLNADVFGGDCLVDSTTACLYYVCSFGPRKMRCEQGTPTSSPSFSACRITCASFLKWYSSVKTFQKAVAFTCLVIKTEEDHDNDNE